LGAVVSIGIFEASARSYRRKRLRGIARPASPRDEEIFAQMYVRLDRPVPICLDRHNFATDDPWSAKIRDTTRSHLPRRAVIRRQQNDRPRPRDSVGDFAEPLGRLWRFFPTYAEIQTGSVLCTSLIATS
jgi:hypothetical protein